MMKSHNPMSLTSADLNVVPVPNVGLVVFCFVYVFEDQINLWYLYSIVSDGGVGCVAVKARRLNVWIIRTSWLIIIALTMRLNAAPIVPSEGSIKVTTSSPSMKWLVYISLVCFDVKCGGYC